MGRWVAQIGRVVVCAVAWVGTPAFHVTQQEKHHIPKVSLKNLKLSTQLMAMKWTVQMRE